MKVIWSFLKWRIFDGGYKVIEDYHCGCCGKYYKEKTIVPTYLISIADKWGICPECRETEDF